MIHGGNVWQGSGPAEWLDYSANIRPDGAPGWVRNALTEAMENVCYYPDPMMKRARAALAEYLAMPADCVLPAAGGISAIDMAACLGNGDCFQFTPCFAEYSMLAEKHGRAMQSIPLIREKHIIGDPAKLAADVLTEGCAVWICNPLNPVGVSFSQEQIVRLLSLIEAKHGWLMVDEAFIEYCPEKSVVQLIRNHKHLVITGSMTKILGIPGVRLGYLCAQADVIESISKRQLTWELSCFAEAVLCAMPGHKAEINAESAINAARRSQLRSGLESLGLYVYPSDAAFLLTDLAMPAAPVAEALFKRGILVRQCMNFPGIDDGRHLRLAVKAEKTNDRLIEALREALKCAENL